jgi:hypothetical protein
MVLHQGNEGNEEMERIRLRSSAGFMGVAFKGEDSRAGAETAEKKSETQSRGKCKVAKGSLRKWMGPD